VKQIDITFYGQSIWDNMAKTECIRDMIVTCDAEPMIVKVTVQGE